MVSAHIDRGAGRVDGWFVDVTPIRYVLGTDSKMSALPPPTSAPAGWYPDPYTGGQRYFDGRTWVGDPLPAAPVLETRSEHPRLPMVAALGALVVLTASLVFGKFVVDELVDREWPLLVYIVVAMLVSYGPSVVWAFVVRRRWGDGTWSSIGWSFRWSDLGWGPLTWLTAVVSEAIIAAVVLTLDVPFTSNVDLDGSGSRDRTYVIAILVAAVIAAPIVEEIIFRGIVMRGFLSRMPAVMAIVLQGLLFGAAHFDPIRGVGNTGLVAVLAGVGIVLGGASYLFRRIGPAVIAHAILNGVALAIALSGWFDDVESPFEMLLRLF
jgi:membrane protease YdiL (CAAX protease family)